MHQPKEDLYTVDYIYSLSEDRRTELIDGVVYDMSAPSTLHQEIVRQVTVQLDNVIKKNNGECKVYPAPFAVTLNETNYVEPDISLICDLKKIDERGCNGVPELIIEVVSPSSVRMDYIIKLNKYINAGVFEYWIIDPLKKQILVYTKADNFVPTTYKLSDEIKVEIIKNCIIKIDL